MKKVSKKLSFTKIWKFIQQFDASIGVFLFKDQTKIKNMKEKLLSLSIPVNTGIFLVFFFSTLIITKFNIINIIFCCSGFVTLLSICVAIKYLILNKDTLIELFQWYESLYDVEKKFHKEVQKIAGRYLESLERKAVKFFKWMRILVYMNAICCTAAFGIISFFLPDNVAPKFTVPIPFYLPFKNQNTWICFVSTVLAQTEHLVFFCNGNYFCFWDIILHCHSHTWIFRYCSPKCKKIKNRT